MTGTTKKRFTRLFYQTSFRLVECLSAADAFPLQHYKSNLSALRRISLPTVTRFHWNYPALAQLPQFRQCRISESKWILGRGPTLIRHGLVEGCGYQWMQMELRDPFGLGFSGILSQTFPLQRCLRPVKIFDYEISDPEFRDHQPIYLASCYLAFHD
jgi:hypothetical protein